MSAIANSKMLIQTKFKHIALPLAYGGGMTAYKNGMACIDTSTGTLKPGGAGNATLKRVGNFDDTYDNSAGSATVLVLVNLDRELVGTWYDNATGGAAVTQLFGTATVIDNNTVGATGSGNAGRVWGLDTIKGVLVVQDS